jgi:hypothetical protein
MADEQDNGRGVDSDGPGAEEHGEASARSDASGADAQDGGADSEDEGTPGFDRASVATSLVTRAVLGQLIVHYEARDVTLVLDGEAAVRLMTMFARRREGGLGDVMDPEESSALSGWLVLDVQEPLAMSWLPGLPSRPQRTAVDPVIAA